MSLAYRRGLVLMNLAAREDWNIAQLLLRFLYAQIVHLQIVNHIREQLEFSIFYSVIIWFANYSGLKPVAFLTAAILLSIT
jgi:hypothetical protein